MEENEVQEVREDVQDGMTEEESHRFDEFEDIRDRLESIVSMIADVSAKVSEGFASVGAIAVESGAVVSSDVEDEEDEDEGFVGIDDLDLSI